MNNKKIDELSNLLMEEKYLKRNLDLNYYKKNDRDKYFMRLKEVKKEIEKIKFKIRLEKQIKKEGEKC